jgi:putative ABC transport system substrate-binding protein
LRTPAATSPELKGRHDYYAKMVELLKTTIPSLTRVAYLRNPTTLGTDGPMAIAEAAAGQLGLDFVELQARNLDEVRAAFTMADAAHAGGMVVATDSAFASSDDSGNLYPASNPLMALPIRYHMPVIYSGGDEYVASGGLMGFGVDVGASYARAATYVDKILHGAAPADLPIEQIDIFDVSVNLSTARAIGIAFPAQLLAQTNQVFQ